MRYLSILLFTTILYSCGDTQEIEKKRMTVTTNSDEAKDILSKSGLDIIPANDMQDAAEKVVHSAINN